MSRKGTYRTVSTGRTYRTRGLALAAICSTALMGLTFVPGSAAAEPRPTLDQARKMVAELQHEAEVAGEAANDLRPQITDALRQVRATSADIRKQQAEVDAIKRQVGALAIASYQQAGMTTTAQLLLSKDPNQFLAQASTAQAFAGQQSAILWRFQTEQAQLSDLQAAERTELAALQQVQAKQDALKKQIQVKLAAAQAVVDKLTDAERQRLAAEQQAEFDQARRERASRDSLRTGLGDVNASGRAKIAVDYAMNQLGDPYVWGADGPNSFDCSGLTMAAWAQAGVSLPHSSKAQYSEGRHISKSDLQPGDLVFFYSPISHVAIYLGNGRIIHAARPGKPVEIADMNTMPYAGAVRPG